MGERPPARPARFLVVGSGWRSAVFLRTAELLPEYLQVAGVVTRSAERGAEVEHEWRVPTSRSIGEVVSAGAVDFVVAAVPWSVTPEVARECVARDLPVLGETPPAPDAAGLAQLWSDVGASGLVQSAEQYLLYPGHAARRRLCERGAIGTVSDVQVSSTHQYHAVSLIRHLLGVGFEDVAVTAHRTAAPLVDPVQRMADPTARRLRDLGWRGDATPRRVERTLAHLDVGDGRTGLYDFTDNQWFNPLRSRRIVIRGSAGEIVDDRVVRLEDATTVMESHLNRRQTGLDLNLEGFDLDHISLDGEVLYRNPWQGVRLSDDEIAVASLLHRTGVWARDDGAPPYPLAQACQDHLVALAIEESIASQRTVRTDRQPWASLDASGQRPE